MQRQNGRPKDRNYDIVTIAKQLKYTAKNKIVQSHQGLTLFKLNEIIKEFKLQMHLKVTDEHLLHILSLCITSDKQTWGFNYVNTMFTTNGFHVPKNQLQRVLKLLDPEASENRWALNISRIPQRYTAGPMHCWCMDMYCKVAFAGIWVYLISDFGSSTVMDIRVMRNPRPESVFVSYYNALTVSHGMSPWNDRMDGGGELVYIKVHQEHRLGLDHVLVGTSTRNVEAERLHRSHFEKATFWFINLLKCWVDETIFDVNNNLHKHSVFEVIAPAMQGKLDYWKHISNNRKRRNQPNRNKPGGVPWAEFSSFFDTTVVGQQQYANFKSDRWTYVDGKFELYAQSMKQHIHNYGDIPIEVPADFNFDKTKYLPGTNIMGELLTENGIKLRNKVIQTSMSSFDANSEEYALTAKYLAHRITTEEILIMSGNLEDLFRIFEPKTFVLRQFLR
eukprot:89660_1